MIELIIVFACLVVPWAIFGLWWWFWLFLSICAVVVIYEIAAYLTKRKTISQMFHAFAKKNKAGAWIIVGCLELGILALIYHLVKGIL